MTKSIFPFLFLLLCGSFFLQAQEASFDENTYYRLTNAWMGEGRSLDVNEENGLIVMSATSDSPSQMWQLFTVGDGWFKLANVLHEGLVIDVINDGNNNMMTLAENAEYGGQFWYIAPERDGSFRIVNGWQNEKSLDCDSDQKGSGAYLNPIGEYSGQFWKISEIKMDAPAPVAPSGGSVKIGDRAHGGIVFFVDHTGEHGLVCQENHFKQLMTYQDAKATCENSTLNEYDDWRLPHPEELLLMFHNLHMTDLAVMGHTLYWSDHVSDEHHMWGIDLNTAKIIDHEDSEKSPVWAVRRF